MPDCDDLDLLEYLASDHAAGLELGTLRSIASLRVALDQPLPLSCYRRLRDILEDHEAGRVIRVFDAAE